MNKPAAAAPEGLCLAAGAPTAPSFQVPPGACDCHLHVLGPFARFPLASPRPYTPPEAVYEDLQAMLSTMGLSRAVVAHVSAHGEDMSVTLDALARMGDRARGTAIASPAVSRGQLEQWHAAGIRGIRLSSAYGSLTPIDEGHVRHWAERIAPMGWHIAMWPSSLAELRLLHRLAPQLPVPLVLDHLASHAWLEQGRIVPEGLDLLHALLEGGNAWLKLSGMYRAASHGSDWAGLVAPMREVMRRWPRRMLWASDWPFVGLYDPVQRPRSGQLLDWLVELGADEALRETILVRNPEVLYGFPPLSR